MWPLNQELKLQRKEFPVTRAALKSKSWDQSVNKADWSIYDEMITYMNIIASRDDKAYR